MIMIIDDDIFPKDLLMRTKKLNIFLNFFEFEFIHQLINMLYNILICRIKHRKFVIEGH